MPQIIEPTSCEVDCWVNPQGKEIVTREFDRKDFSFQPNIWYTFTDIIGCPNDLQDPDYQFFKQIFKSNKYQLIDWNKANDSLTEMNRKFNDPENKGLK